MVPRPIAQGLATLVAAASLAGCTLLLVSTEGLSGGAVDDAAPGSDDGDGHTPPGEAGPTPDGPVISDGAMVDAEAGLGFCAANPGHAFCDDFDDRTDVAQKWSGTSVTGRGVITSDTTIVRSLPRSFASSTPAGTSVVSTANVGLDLGTTNRVRLSFDFNASTPTGNVGDSVATVHFATGYFDLVWFADGKFGLTERADPMAPLDHFSAQHLTNGAWARLQIDVVPGRVVMTLDGFTVIDATTTRPYSGAAGVTLGLYSQDAQGVSFHYDNVLVDTSF